MFTGIIEEVGRIITISSDELEIASSKILPIINEGDSISVNGACLTVTESDDNSIKVNIMPETMKRTNLGLLHSGDRVNLESPVTMKQFLGGHLVQGHIDGTGRITSVKQQSRTILMRIETDPSIMRYIVEKGFIAVDGTSLTVVDLDANSFVVSVVDYTLKNTVLSDHRTGNVVNLEVDIIAKYVERFNISSNPGITEDLLREHGFISG
jgi:riboflavin synthase